MKILLDENLPTKLRFDFGDDFQIVTLKEMGWLGKKNGELLGLLTLNGFGCFVTIDKNLRHQQNLNKFDITIAILMAPNSKIQTLQPYIENLHNILAGGDFSKLIEVWG